MNTIKVLLVCLVICVVAKITIGVIKTIEKKKANKTEVTITKVKK